MILITNTMNLNLTDEDSILDGQLVYRLEDSDRLEITELMKEWIENTFIEVIQSDEDNEYLREDMTLQYVLDLDTHWPVPDGIFVDDWTIGVEGDIVTMEPRLWEFV